jgi:hypothetical protein
MNRLGFIFGLVALIIAGWTLTNRPTASAQIPNQSQMAGYNFQDIPFNYNAGPKAPLPRISRLWKFVGVSGGQQNSNRLWFQDSSGNLIVMNAYGQNGILSIDPTIQILHAGN